MLQRVRSSLDTWQKDVWPKLKEHIQAAKEKAVELGELTEEESEKIAGYLERDLKDIAEFMVDAEDVINDVVYRDVKTVEEKLFKTCSKLADKTTVEYLEFKEDLAHNFEYHTGDVVGLGLLQCDACGEQLHFHQISHIPPCPKCHRTLFRRGHARVG